MALKATIYKADLVVSDMDRGYYATHHLTLAQHPSETDKRLMLRLAAFALHASDGLTFTKGLCAEDEPELWDKSYSGEIELWIELGEPDERRLKKACSRAKQVVLYSYGGRAADVWWSQIAGKLGRLTNLTVKSVGAEVLSGLVSLCERNMQLSATISGRAIVAGRWSAQSVSGIGNIIVTTDLSAYEMMRSAWPRRCFAHCHLFWLTRDNNAGFIKRG